MYVMPFDVLVCMRATPMQSESCRLHLETYVIDIYIYIYVLHRDWDQLLQLLAFSDEFLVCVHNQFASITSLTFVHTARRSYRSNGPANDSVCSIIRAQVCPT